MDWLARYNQLLVNMLGTVMATSAWAKNALVIVFGLGRLFKFDLFCLFLMFG